MAILLYPGGEKIECKPENGRYFTLAEKHRLVPGGAHAIIFFEDDRAMLFDTVTAAFNERATRIVAMHAQRDWKTCTPIFGTVMIFHLSEFENNERCGCPEIHATYDLERIAVARMKMEGLECMRI